mmetsp:Transcript_10102/g.21090  ORF Transcript_10102/g.21090 Transcript_10102/m.21090 type:complete len:379 (+) Transcript_10102:56-1192(+)
MTIPMATSARTLLRSRSLLRGSFDHEQTNATRHKSEHFRSCVITHSQSSFSLESWGDEKDAPQQSKPSFREENLAKQFSKELPPIADDFTKLDHERRVAIATSNGFSYDEASGVTSILNALTPREKKFLADKNMPLRHYRAEKGNLDEAIRKIKSTLKWREEFGVEDIKRCFDHLNNSQQKSDLSPEKEKELTQLANIIAHENETGKIYSRGYDKDGRCILYLTPGRENSVDEINNMRHLVYHLERAIACTRRKSGLQKVCIVIGYQGFKLTNAPPMSTVKHTLTILQGHYPERMYRAYICDPPLVFRTFWNIIKHFIDSATLEKIAFCAGKEGKLLLDRDFDTSNTEKCAGGTGKLREFNSREYLFKTPFDHTFDES